MQITQPEAVLAPLVRGRPASLSTRVSQAQPSLVGSAPADTGAGTALAENSWEPCMFVHPLGVRRPLLFGWVSVVIGPLCFNRDGETGP